MTKIHTPLAYSYREGYVEGIHCGSIAVTDRSGELLFGVGDPHYYTFQRSAIKMIQALPVILSGAAERFGFTSAELALCCASHSGADYHLRGVESILAKIGLGEPSLECGAHEPADHIELCRINCVQSRPSQLHNNCSGKHSGMLGVCLAMGWPTEHYISEEHPLQQWIFDLVSEFSGVPRDRIATAIDGCSLPTYYLPLSATSRALARYVGMAHDGDEPTRRIMNAVSEWPEMIYEHGGFDTELVRALGGRCIAKRGAMAIFVVGIDSSQYGPIGITIKIDDGAITAMPTIVMSVLQQLGLVTDDEMERLAHFVTIPVRNWRGLDVGEISARFELVPAGELSSAPR